MRKLWLFGALASIALLAGCETYEGGHRHGPHTEHERGRAMHAMDGPGPMMMGGPMMRRDPAAMQAFLDRAKADIAITPAQEPAWTAYVAAIEANRAAMAERQPPPAPEAHAPERMQAHLAMMSAHLASMQQVQTALQALYAALSEEQRTRADHALTLHGRRGHGPRHAPPPPPAP